MTKKITRDYEALKENCIALTLWIHMPTGEIEDYYKSKRSRKNEICRENLY